MLVLLVAWALLRVVGNVATAGADLLEWTADAGYAEDDE